MCLFSKSGIWNIWGYEEVKEASNACKSDVETMKAIAKEYLTKRECSV